MLFGKAHDELWRTERGQVLVLLAPRLKLEGTGAMVSADDPSQVLVAGRSADYVLCAGKEDGGRACPELVDRRTAVDGLCDRHVMARAKLLAKRKPQAAGAQSSVFFGRFRDEQNRHLTRDMKQSDRGEVSALLAAKRLRTAGPGPAGAEAARPAPAPAPAPSGAPAPARAPRPAAPARASAGLGRLLDQLPGSIPAPDPNRLPQAFRGDVAGKDGVRDPDASGALDVLLDDSDGDGDDAPARFRDRGRVDASARGASKFTSDTTEGNIIGDRLRGPAGASAPGAGGGPGGAAGPGGGPAAGAAAGPQSAFARRFAGVGAAAGAAGAAAPDGPSRYDGVSRAVRAADDLRRLNEAAVRERAAELRKQAAGDGMLTKNYCKTCRKAIDQRMSWDQIRAIHRGHKIEKVTRKGHEYKCKNPKCRFTCQGWAGESITCRRCQTKCVMSMLGGEEKEWRKDRSWAVMGSLQVDC